MNVGPLVWLLIFDFIVCLIWWAATSLFGITGPDKLVRVMVGLVILINVVVVLFWLLALFGVSTGMLMQGPHR